MIFFKKLFKSKKLFEKKENYVDDSSAIIDYSSIWGVNSAEDIVKLFEEKVLAIKLYRLINPTTGKPEILANEDPSYFTMPYEGEDDLVCDYTAPALKIIVDTGILFFDFLKIANYEALECISDLLPSIAYYMGVDMYNRVFEELAIRAKSFLNTQFLENIEYCTYENSLEYYYPGCFDYVYIDMKKMIEHKN